MSRTEILGKNKQTNKQKHNNNNNKTFQKTGEDGRQPKKQKQKTVSQTYLKYQRVRFAESHTWSH